MLLYKVDGVIEEIAYLKGCDIQYLRYVVDPKKNTYFEDNYTILQSYTIDNLIISKETDRRPYIELCEPSMPINLDHRDVIIITFANEYGSASRMTIRNFEVIDSKLVFTIFPFGKPQDMIGRTSYLNIR